MIYREEIRDLFSVPDEYYLAHCISADLAMDAGIAVEFNKRFNMRNILFSQFGPCLVNKWNVNPQGFCIKQDRVFNLITKRNYWDKPTYKSLTEALEEMKNLCILYNINKVAMPLIGCGIDKLKWDKVSKIIKDIFEDNDIEILVCKL